MSYKHKKRFGQHFLNDNEILENIINYADLRENDTVWEIGPGMGALTDKLIQNNIRLNLFEIDNDLIPILKTKYSNKCNIIHQDILRINWQQELENKIVKIVSNLPYQISSPFLYKISENYNSFETVVIMLQKEVAKRICSTSGKKDYGVLSLKIQFFFNTEYLFEVPPEKFTPPPEVNSSVIKLTPRKDIKFSYNTKFFWQLVENSFRNRRKTLRNNLKIYALPKEILNSDTCPIDLNRRGETLSEEEFITLHNFICKFTSC